MDHDRVLDKLPTTHASIIERRDAKMWRRESKRLGKSISSKSKCPCTLCLFGRPFLTSTQVKHLRDYGQHPLKRLQIEVNFIELYRVLFVSHYYLN